MQPALQVRTQFAMCAQPLQVGAPIVMGAQPSQGKAQYAVGAQPVAQTSQMGAPFAVCAQLATPAGAQPKALAADWDKEDTNALLKLAHRARFCESAGTKIKGHVADVELYARCTTQVTFSWPRSARMRLRKSGARTSQMPSQTTRSSRAVLKRCSASSNSKVRSALSFAHTRSPALNPSLPTLRAQQTSARRPTPRSRRRQLSLAVDHFITGLANATTCDYLLHDRACRSFTWQEVVQMAQACKASRLSLHGPSTFAAAACTKVDAPALAERKCTHDKIIVAPAWQAKSAHDGRVNGGAHLTRKENSRARASASRHFTPQENDSPHPRVACTRRF